LSTQLARNKFWKIIVHLAALALMGWLAIDFLSGNLTINPIQAATQRLGRYALIFLVLTLACTPLNTVFGFKPGIAIRRILGLYAFMFASLHLFMLVGIDYGFSLYYLNIDLGKKPFIWVGLAAFSILMALAITSFDWWKRKLGKNWKRLHRLVYIAGVLVVIHYGWAAKGNLLSIQGNIVQPLIYGGVVILLLLLRLPTLRKFISSMRYQFNRKTKIV
jgi:sulfoxide reductase heme-binding subunit YedZ